MIQIQNSVRFIPLAEQTHLTNISQTEPEDYSSCIKMEYTSIT